MLADRLNFHRYAGIGAGHGAIFSADAVVIFDDAVCVAAGVPFSMRSRSVTRRSFTFFFVCGCFRGWLTGASG